MKCTATTRLTAEECLARLDALRPMPRGLRLEAYAEDNHGVPWCQNRNPLWLDLFDGDGIPNSVSQKGAATWPDPKVIRAYAAPVRRLRGERVAMRECMCVVDALRECMIEMQEENSRLRDEIAYLIGLTPESHEG